MFIWDNVANQKHYISFIIMPMSTRLTKVVTYFEELPLITLHNASMSWSCNYIIISTLRPIGTRLGKVLSYCERLSPLDCLILWWEWRYVTIWKLYISTFKRLAGTKPGCKRTGGGSAWKHLNGHQFLVFFSIFPSRPVFWTDCQIFFTQRFKISY